MTLCSCLQGVSKKRGTRFFLDNLAKNGRLSLVRQAKWLAVDLNKLLMPPGRFINAFIVFNTIKSMGHLNACVQIFWQNLKRRELRQFWSYNAGSVIFRVLRVYVTRMKPLITILVIQGDHTRVPARLLKNFPAQFWGLPNALWGNELDAWDWGILYLWIEGNNLLESYEKAPILMRSYIRSSYEKLCRPSYFQACSRIAENQFWL